MRHKTTVQLEVWQEHTQARPALEELAQVEQRDDGTDSAWARYTHKPPARPQ